MPPRTSTETTSSAKIYEYSAMRVDGTEIVGRATANGELDLDRLLQRDGLMLLKATPSKAGRGLVGMRMKRSELIGFTNQLATMIQAGVPLMQSLQHLGEHSLSKSARDLVQSVLRQIEGGASLSEAFEAHPGVFPSTYVAMVRSGEMSTSLPDVLRRQGAYMDWVREVRGITKQAMIYPTALCFAIIGLVIILVTFLIPSLVGLFPGGDEDLPSQTKFVMGISGFIRSNWVALISAAVTVSASYVLMLKLPSTRMMLSRLLLKIPRLGSLMQMLAVARFSTTASALHQSGCDIVRTLEIAGDSCGNTFMTAKFRMVLESVRDGDSISEGMKAAGDLDPYLVQLTSVGETAGRLGECLEFIAESYNAEVPRVVKWALGLIEPLVLIFGGVIVAFLLLAAILPIFKIYETLG